MPIDNKYVIKRHSNKGKKLKKRIKKIRKSISYNFDPNLKLYS